MSKQGEEALATWLRIMENPRAHTRPSITRSGQALVNHYLESCPDDWMSEILGKAELQVPGIPEGSAALYLMANNDGFAELLGLDPWLLDTPTEDGAELDEAIAGWRKYATTMIDEEVALGELKHALAKAGMDRVDLPTTPEAEAAAFNERYPVGTEVRYWKGYGDRVGPALRSSSTSDAFVCLGGWAAVFVERGAVSVSAPLSHVEPVQ